MTATNLIKTRVSFWQIIQLVIEPCNFESHFSHSANWHAITSRCEKQKLFLQLIAVIVQHLKTIVTRLNTTGFQDCCKNLLFNWAY
jgi:hypothetical protein